MAKSARISAIPVWLWRGTGKKSQKFERTNILAHAVVLSVESRDQWRVLTSVEGKKCWRASSVDHWGSQTWYRHAGR
jgi:hypothetical protein